MQNDKFKIIATKDQLNAMYGLITNSVHVHNDSFEHKLVICELVEIYKKILVKWTFPKKVNTITLTPAQAIAFWLYYNKISFNDPFVFATVNPILMSIHQQYI